MREAGQAERLVLLLQAVYAGTTGTWAIVHRRSFEAVSGPKVDYWLVRMVGSLSLVIGIALVVSARRPRGEDTDRETLTLAAGSALAFGAVDAIYVGKRRIRRVYLADLLAQSLFLGNAVRAARDRRRRLGLSRECGWEARDRE